MGYTLRFELHTDSRTERSIPLRLDRPETPWRQGPRIPFGKTTPAQRLQDSGRAPVTIPVRDERHQLGWLWKRFGKGTIGPWVIAGGGVLPMIAMACGFFPAHPAPPQVTGSRGVVVDKRSGPPAETTGRPDVPAGAHSPGGPGFSGGSSRFFAPAALFFLPNTDQDSRFKDRTQLPSEKRDSQRARKSSGKTTPPPNVGAAAPLPV